MQQQFLIQQQQQMLIEQLQIQMPSMYCQLNTFQKRRPTMSTIIGNYDRNKQ